MPSIYAGVHLLFAHLINRYILLKDDINYKFQRLSKRCLHNFHNTEVSAMALLKHHRSVTAANFRLQSKKYRRR